MKGETATAGGSYLLSILLVIYALIIALLILFLTKFFKYPKHKIIIQLIFIFSALAGLIFFYNFINLVIQILYILPIISANKGFSNKPLSVYAPISIISACDIYYTIEAFLLVGSVGRLLKLFVFVKILLILLNTFLLRAIIKLKSETVVSEKSDAEKQLCILIDKLERKMITDEEYAAEREKIIKSL